MVNAGRYIIVIGGFPDPVGGVTAFVSRLAENNMVSEVIDIYPSPSKSVPSEFKGRVVFVKDLRDSCLIILPIIVSGPAGCCTSIFPRPGL